jgi:hypothetical protein
MPCRFTVTYPTKYKRLRATFPRSALGRSHASVGSNESLEKEPDLRPRPKVLRRQLRAIGGVSILGPDAKLAATGYTPILRPVPDPKERRAAPRKYVRGSDAMCNYVTISSRDVTLPRLSLTATAGGEPKFELELARH